jgi:hypothetical protein
MSNVVQINYCEERGPASAGMAAVAAAAMLTFTLTNESFIRAQSPKAAARPDAPPKVSVDESVGIDGIVRTLIASFDQVDIVALGR